MHDSLKYGLGPIHIRNPLGPIAPPHAETASLVTQGTQPQQETTIQPRPIAGELPQSMTAPMQPSPGGGCRKPPGSAANSEGLSRVDEEGKSVFPARNV